MMPSIGHFISLALFGKSINKKTPCLFIFLNCNVTFFQMRDHHEKMVSDFNMLIKGERS